MKSVHDFEDAALRVFDRPKVTASDSIRSVYLIGVCGTGMGALAGLFREAGLEVTGSDANAYPPMSTWLQDAGIRLIEGYRPENLDFRPDLVVVGNACTPSHPEATRARNESMPQLSLPEAFAEFFIGTRRSLVVAGTHGKTTTSGLLAHTAVASGLDPTFLVGGVLLNGEKSFRIGRGNYAIVEGDEYDTAYFDKRPKFMLYRPTSAIVTSMEMDHADIYEDWEDYRSAFERFVATLPDDGYLVLNADDRVVVELAGHTSASPITYGLEAEADVMASNVSIDSAGLSFDLHLPGEHACRVVLPMTGRHNLSNALAVTAIAWSEGVGVELIRDAFASFKGMKRRQEIIGDLADVLVIDDFAHHPTAVAVTVAGVRERWPNRRLVAVFEPRSNSSRRKVFEQQYVRAFSQANSVFIAEPPFRHNDSREDFMDVHAVCASLGSTGVPAFAAPDQESLRARLRAEVDAGDVVLIMSNGGFGALHSWILEELRSRLL